MLQLSDLLAGVDFTKKALLRDYIKPLRNSTVSQAMEELNAMYRLRSGRPEPGRQGVGVPRPR